MDPLSSPGRSSFLVVGASPSSPRR